MHDYFRTELKKLAETHPAIAHRKARPAFFAGIDMEFHVKQRCVVNYPCVVYEDFIVSNSSRSGEKTSYLFNFRDYTHSIFYDVITNGQVVEREKFTFGVFDKYDLVDNFDDIRFHLLNSKSICEDLLKEFLKGLQASQGIRLVRNHEIEGSFVELQNIKTVGYKVEFELCRGHSMCKEYVSLP